MLQQPQRRTISSNTFKALTRQRYGTILAPVKIKPNLPSFTQSLTDWFKSIFTTKHYCKPPGFFHRFFLRAIAKPMKEGSLYRCPCGIIHELIDAESGDDYWYNNPTQEMAQKKWCDMGGQL